MKTTVIFVVQSPSRVQLCDTMDCNTVGLPVPHHLLGFAYVHVHCIGDAISSPDALFSFCPQSFPASGTFPVNQLFSIRWPKYWSFDFSISPFNEYSGLISFKIDWFDLLAVQGTLRSLLQHHSLKESILWHSAFFMVQLSQPYVTTEIITLTIRNFIGRVMSVFQHTI